MKRINVSFYSIVVFTVLVLIGIVSGLFDEPAANYYLSVASVVILFYSIRTFRLIQPEKTALAAYHLNLLEKIAGYVGILNGFFFAVLALIFFGEMIYSLFTGTRGMGVQDLIIIPFFLYGYCQVSYCGYTLRELKR